MNDLMDITKAMGIIDSCPTKVFARRLPYSGLISPMVMARGSSRCLASCMELYLDRLQAYESLTTRLSEDNQPELKPAFLIDMENRVIEETFGRPEWMTKYQQKPVDCSKYIIMEKEDE
jgi:hypothetical protein